MCSAATSPARIANLRTVDWQSLGINFVLVFSPNAFKGAPHTHIATLTYPGGSTTAEETALLKARGDAFPTVTTVRVREALDAVGSIVTNLVLAIRGASAVTLISAILVLGGALAAGHRHRVYDAVILKTLGATRARLLGAYALEYLVLGLATALFGVAAGSIAAGLVMTRVMDLPFALAAGPGGGAALGALVGHGCAWGLRAPLPPLAKSPRRCCGTSRFRAAPSSHCRRLRQGERFVHHCGNAIKIARHLAHGSMPH